MKNIYFYSLATLLAASAAATVVPFSVKELQLMPNKKTSPEDLEMAIIKRVQEHGTTVASFGIGTQADFDRFTVIDSNEDGTTWQFDADRSLARCSSADHTSDDWLITPSFTPVPGHSYTVILSIEKEGYYSTEKIEVKAGAAPQADDMTESLLGVTWIRDSDNTDNVISCNFTPEDSSEIYIGLHKISDSGQGNLVVKGIRIVDMTSLPPAENPRDIFSRSFNSKTCLDGFSVIDANEDGKTWSVVQGGRKPVYTYTLRCGVSEDNASDDWLVLPAQQLVPGRKYQLKASLYPSFDSRKIEVKFGMKSDQSVTAEDMTSVILEPTVIEAVGSASTVFTLETPVFTVSADAEYSIGIHSMGDPATWDWSISELKVIDLGAVVAIDPVDAPYVSDLTDAGEFNKYDTVDADGDGFSWIYDYEMCGSVVSKGNPEAKADNWLITPAIVLEKQKGYHVTVIAQGTDRSQTKTFEAYLGQGTDPAAYSTKAIDAVSMSGIDLTDDAVISTGDIVRVAEDGEYSIAVHDISEAGGSDLAVYKVQIEEVFIQTPIAVADLAVTPDPEGLVKASISFTAPTRNIGGDEISGTIDRIVIRRGAEVIKSYEEAVPGQKYEFTDVPPVGSNTYIVTSYMSDYASAEAEASAFVGADIPLPVHGFTCEEIPGGIRFNCEEVEEIGVNGQSVFPATVVYNFYRMIPTFNSAGQITDLKYEKLASSPKVPFDFDFPEFHEGEQEPWILTVRPESAGGEGTSTEASSMLKGKPYALPMLETVADGKFSHFFTWNTESQTGNSGVYLFGTGYDDEHALCIGGRETNTSSALISGKINISEAENPKLSFYVWNIVDNYVQIYVMGPDAQWIPASEKMQPSNDGWQEITCSLSDYKDLPWVSFIIVVTTPDDIDAEKGSVMAIDKIHVYDYDGSGIDSIENTELSNMKWHTIDGRAVNGNSLETLEKGIYIVNGSKILIK